MEWFIINPSSIHQMCSLLGHKMGEGEYVVETDTCTDGLDELLNKLSSDGPNLKSRRSLGLSQVVTKDLIPLLIASTSQHPSILPKLIKLLAYLTSPVECLVSSDFVGSEEGQQVVFEVESLLRSIKVEFAEINVTKAVVEFLKNATSKPNALTTEECGGVSDGLLLLRNVLHIPHEEAGLQHQILWNLFAHNVDKILLTLMTCEQKSVWGIALVQLISLIYKDQHVAHLQKLLNLWLENSVSESSEMSEDLDNESNTSPPDHSSSPTLTSDPTSDMSDGGNNNGNGGDEDGVDKGHSGQDERKAGDAISKPSQTAPSPKDLSSTQKIKSKGKSKSKERSLDKSDVDSGISSSHFSTEKLTTLTEDGGHGTSYKETECNSTSSNEDDLLQKVKARTSKLTGKSASATATVKLMPKLLGVGMLSATDKREMKRKKLHKRSKRAKNGNFKALVHHHYATEEDVSHVLREFTVDFLLKGYGSLVAVLQEQLSHNPALQMDKSYFLWLITYFLKFASQMELDLEHIAPVLSHKILSYLTYEGVTMCENLAICKDDLKPHLRRMHLVVTALREFVQAVEIYSQLPSCSREDKMHISTLQSHLLGVEELRHLFLLLIRYFKPGVQSKQYLQDLITTNHVFLLLLEKVSSKADYTGSFRMCEFVKEFSSPVIMQQYGHLLEDFQNNGEFVNDCVFTMMHHIAGDLGCPEALYQPSILKTFSSIWEVEFAIRDDWADLIEYVIQRFMKASNDEKRHIFKSGTSNDSDDVGWSKEDFNNLYWYYSTCSTSSDPIAKILELYGESASGSGKTRESILNQLLHQRIIGYNQFLRFLASERAETRSDGAATDGSSRTSSSHATAGSSCHSASTHLDEGLEDNRPEKGKEGLASDNNNYDNINLINLSLSDNDKEMKNLSGFEESERSQIPLDFQNQNYIFSTIEEGLEIENENMDTNSNCSFKGSGQDSIEIAIGELIKQIIGEGQDLSWLQSQVLEACYVKFALEMKRRRERLYTKEIRQLQLGDEEEAERTLQSEEENMGPIPYHYSLLGQSIPIIPWTNWQEILLRSPLYLLLLHKLGFHLPCDVGKLFPRIPHFWTADVLLSVAGKLGPLPAKEKMKVDPSEVINAMESTANANVNGASQPDHEEREEARSVPSADLTFKMNSYRGCSGIVSGHTRYGFGSASHAVNWMNLSKVYLNRHSEPANQKMNAKVCSNCSSSDEDEGDESQFDDYENECSSLKALPPTEKSISEATMMSQGSCLEEGERLFELGIG